MTSREIHLGKWGLGTSVLPLAGVARVPTHQGVQFLWEFYVFRAFRERQGAPVAAGKPEGFLKSGGEPGDPASSSPGPDVQPSGLRGGKNFQGRTQAPFVRIVEG